MSKQHSTFQRLASVMMAAIAVLAVGTATAGAQGYGGNDGVKISNQSPGTGDTIEIVVGGFAPNTEVQLELHSDPVLLGTFRSDGAGVVRASVTLPQGVTGSHSVVAVGVSAAGAPMTVSAAVTISPAKEEATGILALTGSDSRSLIALGSILVLIGVAATVTTRKRMADQS